MSWIDRGVASAKFAALLLTGCVPGAGPNPNMSISPAICPAAGGAVLSALDIFAGEPARGKVLMADDAKVGTGFFSLAYLYQRGTFATVRCRYGDGSVVIVPLTRPVTKCLYRMLPDGVPDLRCR